MNGAVAAAVALGGAVGALGRHLAVQAIVGLTGRGFPYGTLTVNVCGCLAMGLALALGIERGLLAEPWRAGLIVGVLGGFTTFSAFSAETLVLFETGRAGAALANLGLSAGLCLVAVWAGATLGRAL